MNIEVNEDLIWSLINKDKYVEALPAETSPEG